MQAYQTRALELIDHVAQLGRTYRVRLMCRLVKGAYWDAEVKRAQELGLPHYPVFTHKHHTDVSYLACARALLAASDVIFPQFATHNAATIAALLQMGAKSAAPFELQRLHGMGEGVYREVLKNPLVGCRVYAPVGAHKDLLAYLVRRLLENGANSSFVHQLADESVGMEELLISPLRLEPHPSLPLPDHLFGADAGGRLNSAGLDLTVPSMTAPLWAAFESQTVPPVALTELAHVGRAFGAAKQNFPAWNRLGALERSRILQAAADQLQTQMPAACALLVKEAFKTWGDAVAEVREAVDFLRYYALEAERIMQPMAMPQTHGAVFSSTLAFGMTGETNTLSLTGRGVWVFCGATASRRGRSSRRLATPAWAGRNDWRCASRPAWRGGRRIYRLHPSGKNDLPRTRCQRRAYRPFDCGNRRHQRHAGGL
jgi:RHH-type proline utilization regulon transcriptional repressor/proline dehydrogenase/delta 1-pyrroline-5-carboxylate dehydrogenase